MKTASRIFLTLGLVLFLAGATFSQAASIASTAKSDTKQTTAAPGKFVDTNKNGVCDNHEAKGGGTQGKNFKDKNGDGKCDNGGSNGKCTGTGCGKGQGKGNCCGQGQGNGNGCGQGHQPKNGCSGQGSGATTQPKK